MPAAAGGSTIVIAQAPPPYGRSTTVTSPGAPTWTRAGAFSPWAIVGTATLPPPRRVNGALRVRAGSNCWAHVPLK